MNDADSTTALCNEMPALLVNSVQFNESSSTIMTKITPLNTDNDIAVPTIGKCGDILINACVQISCGTGTSSSIADGLQPTESIPIENELSNGIVTNIASPFGCDDPVLPLMADIWQSLIWSSCAAPTAPKDVSNTARSTLSQPFIIVSPPGSARYSIQTPRETRPLNLPLVNMDL
ncbi:hypothetical protein K432DRAFT_399054 [Lepidopterella palustris CBS 459.81]|uniref:Uncharacterized protein n=1 Tax=Lepidopterella palustris CBS 459.81 TaxID=1314670 RepID=A0A8E2DWT7_9PEZI|nr:hypothetical protein K432DRAFT_399054 [Lepidopterella palustris CBS 459.81]